MIRVAVRADAPLIHAGLESELQQSPGIDLRQDLAEADVVLASGEGAVRTIPDTPTWRLVLIADKPRPAVVWTAVERGLAVLVPREEATTPRLLRAIVDAFAGRGHIPPDCLGAMLRGLSQLQRQVLAPRDLTFTGLSRREADILQHLAEGLNTSQIATLLSYSESTVKGTLQAMICRLGLRNRTQAIAYAIRNGLI